MLNKLRTNLEAAPKTREEYLWADYVELRCLASVDREISEGEISEILHQRKDFGEPDSDSEIVEFGEEPIEAEEEDTSSTPAEAMDKDSAFVSNIFRHLSFRSNSIGASYPFTIATGTEGTKVLKRHKRLNNGVKLYIFLVCAANPRYFGNRYNLLTTAFERISVIALHHNLKAPFEVHPFGAASGGKYTGSLWNKLNGLANDLRVRLKPDRSEFASSDNGDGGIDIVSFLQFDDNCDGLFMIFGQAACSFSDWVEKQHSCGPGAIKGLFDLNVDFIHMILIPQDYRREDGSWYRTRTIQGSVLIDRLRLIRLLKTQYLKAAKLIPEQLIGDLF